MRSQRLWIIGFNEAEARAPRMGGKGVPTRMSYLCFNEAEARAPRMAGEYLAKVSPAELLQ